MRAVGRGAVPWSVAWARAAYGEHGFWRDAAAMPARHFRTSAHVGDGLGAALARLLLDIDATLGHPDVLDVVDVGAGAGELAAALLGACERDLRARVRVTALDLRARPDGLPSGVAWTRGAAPDAVPDGMVGLMVANEWLDEVPLDVVEVDGDGVRRLVLVDVEGRETLGPAIEDRSGCAAVGVDADDLAAWLHRWWSLRAPGDRAEVGTTRDVAWTACVDRLAAGTALAIDYGHVRDARPRRGSLSAYAGGSQVRPVPDGRTNLTAHVALDSLAASVGGAVTTQAEALRALGVDAMLPDRGLASDDPARYAERLVLASQASELLDPAGLGGFGWVRVDR